MLHRFPIPDRHRRFRLRRRAGKACYQLELGGEERGRVGQMTCTLGPRLASDEGLFLLRRPFLDQLKRNVVVLIMLTARGGALPLGRVEFPPPFGLDLDPLRLGEYARTP